MKVNLDNYRAQGKVVNWLFSIKDEKYLYLRV